MDNSFPSRKRKNPGKPTFLFSSWMLSPRRESSNFYIEQCAYVSSNLPIFPHPLFSGKHKFVFYIHMESYYLCSLPYSFPPQNPGSNQKGGIQGSRLRSLEYLPFCDQPAKVTGKSGSPSRERKVGESGMLLAPEQSLMCFSFL